MHKNARFNILQAPGNGNSLFLVIDGQRTDSGHAARGAERLYGLWTRDQAIRLADDLQAFHNQHGLDVGHFVTWGKLFTTFAFATDDQANAFMLTFPYWDLGLLGISHDGLRHVAHRDDRGIALPPPQRLLCACCGSVTFGRQWWNQDSGYGLCEVCGDRLPSKVQDMAFTYGYRNVHYAIHPNQGE